MQFQLYFTILFTVSELLTSDPALELVVYQWHKRKIFCSTAQVSNCGCKALLQFKGWFLTLTGSNNDLKGILTLQPTCSIFHLPSLCPYVPLLKLCLTLENQGSQWLAALKECSWWKRTDAVAEENRFPCSQISAVTKQVYPKKANLDIWIIAGQYLMEGLMLHHC